jgi:hypothetical protein
MYASLTLTFLVAHNIRPAKEVPLESKEDSSPASGDEKSKVLSISLFSALATIKLLSMN